MEWKNDFALVVLAIGLNLAAVDIVMELGNNSFGHVSIQVATIRTNLLTYLSNEYVKHYLAIQILLFPF